MMMTTPKISNNLNNISGVLLPEYPMYIRRGATIRI